MFINILLSNKGRRMIFKYRKILKVLPAVRVYNDSINLYTERI